MEKVLTGANFPAHQRDDRLESTPPERNAPSGTSEMSLKRTASLSTASARSPASCSSSFSFFEKSGCQSALF